MTTLELTDTIERLLIYSNDQEINRITNETKTRVKILNDIGLSSDEIKTITASKAAIDEFIFQEQMKVNRVLMSQYKAGKKAEILMNEYTLPDDLQNLKFGLLAWHNYNGNRNKFEFIANHSDQFEVDNEALEKNFIQRQWKIYLTGDSLEKYHKAQQLCELLEFFQVPWNHLAQSSALSRILEINGHGVKPRWTYFCHG